MQAVQSNVAADEEATQNGVIDYICFQVPDHSFANVENCMAIVRGDISGDRSGEPSLEATLLSIPSGFSCVDLALYKVLAFSLSTYLWDLPGGIPRQM